LRPHGQGQDRRPRILEPVADAAVEEVSRGRAVPRIVEPEEGAALAPRPGFERQRLGAFLVRPETAEEYHARPRALQPVMGDPPPFGCHQIVAHALTVPFILP